MGVYVQCGGSVEFPLVCYMGRKEMEREGEREREWKEIERRERGRR